MWLSGISKDVTGIAAYEIARTLAAEQLKLGISVIIDAVNPVEPARNMWRTLAEQYSTQLIIIEVICSDVATHKQRIENRKREIAGMPEVTWSRVEERRAEYQPWQDEHLELDSIEPIDDLFDQALDYIKVQVAET